MQIVDRLGSGSLSENRKCKAYAHSKVSVLGEWGQWQWFNIFVIQEAMMLHRLLDHTWAFLDDMSDVTEGKASDNFEADLTGHHRIPGNCK